MFLLVVECESVGDRVFDTVAAAFEYGQRLLFSLGVREAERKCVAIALCDCCPNHLRGNTLVYCIAVDVSVCDFVQLSLCLVDFERERLPVSIRVDCTDEDAVAAFLPVVECESIRERLFDALAVAIKHN